jgi:replication fork protection complex subunit Tof1/Swi1
MENLHRLLQAEEKIRRDTARKASPRHSRFGTTISVSLNPNKKPAVPIPDPSETSELPDPNPSASQPQSQSFILHRQSALTSSPGTILDFRKQTKSRPSHARVDDLGTSAREEDNLGVEAKGVLRRFAVEVVGGGCFNRELFLFIIIGFEIFG